MVWVWVTRTISKATDFNVIEPRLAC